MICRPRSRVLQQLALFASPFLCLPLVYAQTQNAGNTPISEYVTVTGSHISRLDVAGAVPVVSITRDDIERSGVMTVGELLQQSPMDNGGTFNDTANNTFAAGGTGVSLRGLGANTVLVLINGRRATNYGFANRNATFTSFVDLNSIPLGIV